MAACAVSPLRCARQNPGLIDSWYVSLPYLYAALPNIVQTNRKFKCFLCRVVITCVQHSTILAFRNLLSVILAGRCKRFNKYLVLRFRSIPLISGVLYFCLCVLKFVLKLRIERAQVHSFGVLCRRTAGSLFKFIVVNDAVLYHALSSLYG